MNRLFFLFLMSSAIACWAAQSLADSPSAAPQPPVAADHRLIRVRLDTPERVAALKRAVRPWDVAGTVDRGQSIDLVVTAEERQALGEAGIPFAIVPVEPLDQTRATYHTFAQMESSLAGMAATYPAITDLQSIGTSWESRDIWCIEISDNPGVDEGEPGLQFMGLTHAREWPSLEVALDIAARLTAGYGSDPTITSLVDNHRIWVIPCVNPDGLIYSQTVSEFWRTNRHPYPGGVGVDLNRNFDGAANGSKDGEWGSIGPGSQTHQPGEETYVGPGPFSEPETQVIRDFFSGRDVTISVSYHTYSELVLWSWGYNSSVQTDDDALLVSIGQGMAAQIGGYIPEQASDLYPTTGASDDWAYGCRYYQQGKNTLAYTVEIGTSFHPAASQLQGLLDENWDGALYVMQQAAAAEAQLTPFVLPPILTTPATDADGDYTVSWAQQNPDAGVDLYELQELTGLSTLSDGAEGSTANWNIQQFVTSTARKHSGTKSYKSPTGSEKIAAMTTISPLPVETGDTFSFWTWYDIELDWDMAFVEVSIDGLQFDILGKFTGSSGAWVQKTYNLDAYAGRSVYFRFRYTTDGAVTEEGFYVDDITPVASWAGVSTLSSSIAATSYPIADRPDGDYYYRVRGSSPTRGFGQFSDLGLTRVVVMTDCNMNGVADADDISSQFSRDCDADQVPDECQSDFADADLFVAEMLADVPNPYLVCLFDQNGDVLLDGRDAQGFVTRLLPP